MTTVMIRLVLTIEIPKSHPLRLERLVPIQLGRNLDGSPIRYPLGGPGTANEGVLEVDLVQIPNVETEFQSQTLEVSISRFAPNGTLATSETCLRPQPTSPAYRQLKLLEAKYTSENSDA